MIISRDTNPAKDLYYAGGLILQYFIKDSIKTITPYRLIQNLKNECKLSTNIIYLSLDWLYIIGSIDLNENGEIVTCF